MNQEQVCKYEDLKHDYSIFSKKELSDFLEKYENMFRILDSPFNLLISVKMDSVMHEIEKVNNNFHLLNMQYSQSEEKDNIAYMVKTVENHKKWNKLNKEYDRLSELRFGKEILKVGGGI